MKKYVKPELCYESFELSEQIAVGCSWKATYRDGSDCRVDLGGTYLMTDTAVCTDPSRLEGYCYTAGADGMTIFTS